VSIETIIKRKINSNFSDNEMLVRVPIQDYDCVECIQVT